MSCNIKIQKQSICTYRLKTSHCSVGVAALVELILFAEAKHKLDRCNNKTGCKTYSNCVYVIDIQIYSENFMACENINFKKVCIRLT